MYKSQYNLSYNYFFILLMLICLFNELFNHILKIKDIEALKAELSDPRFSTGAWQDQINMMLENGKKANLILTLFQ